MNKVLITGASRRLGLFLTEQFLAENWQVHALTRHASPELNKLSCSHLTLHEIGNYDEQSVQHFISSYQLQNDTLDLVLHNASIYETDDSLSIRGPEFYLALMHIHMMLPALLTHGLLPELKAVNGNIISITDIYADNPNPDYGLYCSTKAGLQSLTLGFAKKFAPEIRANCIQPGPIKFLDNHSDKHKSNVLRETLLATEGGFEPIYKTVKFILDNNYVTGDCIKVDGGRSLVRG